MTKRVKRTLRRRSVDSSIERLIVTGLIMSRDFTSNIIDRIEPRLFKMEFAALIAKWCRDYYQQENRSPKAFIQNIYDIEKEELPAAVQTITESFLHNLSEDFQDSEGIDVDYLTNKADEYFRARAIDVLADDITRLARAGKHDRAAKMIDVYTTNAGIVSTHDRLENLFSNEAINLYGPDEDEFDYLFQYDYGNSAIGQLLGKLKRGYLAGFLAPMKRGKTWFLDSLGIEATLQGLSVFKFSLEMPQKQQAGRIYQQIGGLTETGNRVLTPCFDCHSNQDGSCDKDFRTSDVKLIVAIDDDGNPVFPEFKPRMRYKVCTACRDTDQSDDYLPAVWYTTIASKSKTTLKLRKKIKQFKTHGGNKYLAKSYRFDGTIANIKADINYAIATGERKPDVIIVDYADIVQVDRSEIFGTNDRATFDYVWKALKRMAMEYDCLVLTATQGNRKSFLQDSLNETNVSEDVRKLAHCDVMWALNQRPGEYKRGVIRASTLLHRHAAKNIDRQVAVLQQLEIGATILDSEWINNSEKLF